MPTFRRSPRRLRHQQRKEEDGSFNFQPTVTPTNNVNANRNAINTPNVMSLAGLRSLSSEQQDESSSTEDDDNSYKRRFFRTSPKKKNRKSLQHQERVSLASSSAGSMMMQSHDDGSIRHVIEKEFVPFRAMKHSYTTTGKDSVLAKESLGHHEYGDMNASNPSPRDGLGISARRIGTIPTDNHTPSPPTLLNDNYSDRDETDGDERGDDDDDESFRSINSLKISAMNKAKRREFLKQHLKNESRKEQMNAATMTSTRATSPFEANMTTTMPGGSNPLSSSSSFASSHLILPPRIETATETFETFQQVAAVAGMGDSRNGDSFVDPWAPLMDMDEDMMRMRQDDVFDFPSDPFAEFDAQRAIDVQKEKISGSMHVVNKVFGFTPTRKKSAGKVLHGSGKSNEEKEESISLVQEEMGVNRNVLRPPSPLLPPDDMDTTRDSSEIAIASAPSERHILRHKKQASNVSSSSSKVQSVVQLPSPFRKSSPKKSNREKFRTNDRPMKDVNVPTSSEESVSSSIGESIEVCSKSHLVHISDFLKLDEAERVKAYSDLLAVAAETMNDVDEKRQEIQVMNSKVDDLVKRVTEMEYDREAFEKKNAIAKKEILHMRGIIKTNSLSQSKVTSFGTASSAGAGPDEVAMLKSELESKDIIIEALQKSMDEWKHQEHQTKKALDKSLISIMDIGEKPTYTKAEVELIRSRLIQAQENVIKDYETRMSEVKRQCDETVAQKDAKLKEQSSLISQQKAMILEAREEIQAMERQMNDLRTGTSKKNAQADESAVEKDQDMVNNYLKSPQTRSSRVLDVNIPIGTVKARVALAASRAMKNAATVNVSSPFNRIKELHDLSTKSASSDYNNDMPLVASSMTLDNGNNVSEEVYQQAVSELDKRNELIEQLRIEMDSQIKKLTSDKEECVKNLEEEKDALKTRLDKLLKDKEGLERKLIEIQKSHTEDVDRLKERQTDIENQLKDVGCEDVRHLKKIVEENDGLKTEISILNKRLESLSSGKVTKDDENKFADIEDGYKAEIEGLIHEKKEIESKLDIMGKAYEEELKSLTRENEEYKRIYNDLKDTHETEISRLNTEREVLEETISALKKSLNEIEQKQGPNNKKSDVNLGDDEEDGNFKHEVGEATCETGSHELDEMKRQNQRLLEKVKSLENEIETVSGLLEETIMSIKEKDDEIDALKRDNASHGNGVLGRFSGQAAKGTEQKKIKNCSNYTDEEIKQLERICKLHQLTIIRQRSQAKTMKVELDEALSQTEKYKADIKVHEEKISILESQFAELNKTMDNNGAATLDIPNDDAPASIIKVDAAYLSSLQSRESRDKALIEGLQNEKRILKERIESMKEKLNMENVLRARVDDLTTSLEARELELKALEEAYRSRRVNVQRSIIGLPGSVDNSYDCDENDDMTVDELKEVLLDRDKMIAQLKSHITSLEQSLKTAGPRGAILNLRKVSLLQEMQDAIIRRLNVLITRLDDDKETGVDLDQEFLSPSKSFLITMSDKLSLLHDYQKISLHLIESRLSNEIESLQSNGKPVEMNEEVVTRFEHALKTLESTKNDISVKLEEFSSELQNHNIKLAAKNGVIEKLISKDQERRCAIDALEKELQIFKGLSEYQSINMGVMARFKECALLEQQLQEKEMVIKRLNDVIEEYRYENQ